MVIFVFSFWVRSCTRPAGRRHIVQHHNEDNKVQVLHRRVCRFLSQSQICIGYCRFLELFRAASCNMDISGEFFSFAVTSSNCRTGGRCRLSLSLVLAPYRGGGSSFRAVGKGILTNNDEKRYRSKVHF